MAKVNFNRPIQVKDINTGKTVATVKVLRFETCNKLDGYDTKVTCQWLAGGGWDDMTLVVYVNSATGACADHEGCPLAGIMANKAKGMSRNQRRKIARLKAIDAHNTQLVLARKEERKRIITANMSTPKERTYGLRAASVYQRGLYKN